MNTLNLTEKESYDIVNDCVDYISSSAQAFAEYEQAIADKDKVILEKVASIENLEKKVESLSKNPTVVEKTIEVEKKANVFDKIEVHAAITSVANRGLIDPNSVEKIASTITEDPKKLLSLLVKVASVQFQMPSEGEAISTSTEKSASTSTYHEEEKDLWEKLRKEGA